MLVEPQGVLTDDELNRMAAEAARFLPTNVTIYRSQKGDNEQGDESRNMDAIGIDIPARLSPISTRALLQNVADRENIKFPWFLTLPAFTDCEPEDEIVWQTRRFVVISALKRDYEVTRRLICDELVG